jgi:pimeloyl-ACP methyl ester carboxylesterase
MVESSRARRPAFASPGAEARFTTAYDAVLDQWPIPVDAIDVPSRFGSTRVNVCGPVDGPPLVLLHGGGATSTVWFANVEELGRAHRIYAVDQMGDAGRSVHDGPPIRGSDDYSTWLDELCDHLGLGTVALCGHSYGAWLALNLALHVPQRVRALVLLDPTACFSGMRLGYRLHAIPLFARPTEQRMRNFLRWETGGAALDPAWLELAAIACADVRTSPVVQPRRPAAAQLRASTVPTLVLLAEASRQHDTAQVAGTARDLMPVAQVAVLPSATHHTIPTVGAARLNREVLRFLP